MSSPLSVLDITGLPSDGGELVAQQPDPGIGRAALALLALGVDHAAEVLKLLPEEQAERLTAEMAQLGNVDAHLLDAVAGELVVQAGGDVVQGGINYTREVLERVVGEERAGELIERFLGAEVKPFDFMRGMSAEEIADLLDGESPQTIALVAGNVKPGLSGRILDLLAQPLQAEVAYRIARLSTLDPRLLDDLDRGLREKAASDARRREDPMIDGIDTLAEILQGAGRATERQVLGGLEGVDPKLAAAVRARLFTFDDIVKLSDKDLQLVLREVDTKELVVALRGVSPELLQRIVENMSQRAGETLREELEMQAPKKRAVVEEAQTQVVMAIRRLDEEGSITLPGRDGGDDPTEVLL